MSKKDKGLDIIEIGGILLILVVVVAVSSIASEPITKEEFKVTTKANETYNIKIQHRCKKHLRKAVNHIFSVQDTKIKKKRLDLLLPVIKDLTHAYEGKVKGRCDIILLKAKRKK